MTVTNSEDDPPAEGFPRTYARDRGRKRPNMSQARPRATSEIHVRIPKEEKDALQAEARKHGISMSALIRLDCIAAREQRQRAALMQKMYPGKTVDTIH